MKRRSVWVVEWKHSLGWTPLESRRTCKEARQQMKERAGEHHQDKFRVVRYDTSK